MEEFASLLEPFIEKKVVAISLFLGYLLLRTFLIEKDKERWRKLEITDKIFFSLIIGLTSYTIINSILSIIDIVWTVLFFTKIEIIRYIFSYFKMG